jgi:hypothetical protein
MCHYQGHDPRISSAAEFLAFFEILSADTFKRRLRVFCSRRFDDIANSRRGGQ